MSKKVHARARVEVGGFYRWSLVGKDGKVKDGVDEWMPNLVLDQCLDLAMTNSSRFGGLIGSGTAWSMVVGTGSNTPANSDTALQAQVGARESAESAEMGFDETGDPYHYLTREFEFSGGDYENENLTEFGLTRQITFDHYLMVRQLFRDAGGSPITITPQPGEILRVEHEMRVYWPSVVEDELVDQTINDTTTTLSIYPVPALQKGTTLVRDFGLGFDTVAMTVNGGGSRLWLSNDARSRYGDPPVDANRFSGGADSGPDATSVTQAAYTNGTFAREVTFVWEPAEGALTFDGFVNSTLSSECSWCFVLDRSLTKSADERLTLVIEWSIDRYTPA